MTASLYFVILFFLGESELIYCIDSRQCSLWGTHLVLINLFHGRPFEISKQKKHRQINYINHHQINYINLGCIPLR